MNHPSFPDEYLNQVILIARKAGKEIINLYNQEMPLEIKLKVNKTPVTQADLIANEVIRDGLAKLTPDIPLISEEMEQVPFDVRKKWQQFWLVDPLDGTKEFINRTHDFTVNIALISEHESVLGVIYLPFFDTLYFACKGKGAFKQLHDHVANPIHIRKIESSITAAISRRHGSKTAEILISKIGNCEILSRGSSIKSCLVAEGIADFYPAFGLMSEWDIAAAQCIVEQAGGAVWDESLQSMRYNTRTSLLNPRLLVVGDCSFNWKQYVDPANRLSS